MGDRAEGAFEHWCATEQRNYVRWGLDRPPLNLRLLPARLRYAPDYLMSAQFVECQGFGQDGTFKLKLEKHGALHWWHGLHPVDLWILDSHHGRACFLTLPAFDDLLGATGAELRSFPEGKSYFAVDGDDIFAAAGERVYAAET